MTSKDHHRGAVRVCDAAERVLLESGNPAVMWGDERLCHMIAERCGWEPQGPATSKRVLAALSKTPGRLVPRLVAVTGHRGGEMLVRRFELQTATQRKAPGAGASNS